MAPTRIRVRTPDAPYDILVGEGIWSQLADLIGNVCPAPAYAIISDQTVRKLYGARVQSAIEVLGDCHLIDFPTGERHKNRKTWQVVTDTVAETGLGRDGVVIALGGGVAGDLAGFVAATYHRGIPWVQLPTTLLAMVDSSIGGKTGVDTAHGKNLVGAFHQPRLVVADTTTLETLPDEQLVNGMAEVIKHAAIADAEHFNELIANRERILGREQSTLRAIISRSAHIKSDVVSADARENGRRAVLNLGHSIGHALESASRFRIPHGHCVAAGMYLEALVGQELSVTRPSVAASLKRAFEAFGFPRANTFRLSPESVLAAVTFDKKNRRSKLRFALLEDLGHPAQTKAENWTFEVPEKVLRKTLKSEL